MTGQAPEKVRPAAILAVLAVAGSSYTLLQSMVVPALLTLQKDLHASTSGVAWVFTAYLLAASVATPIAGRLGDMFGKRRVLVISMLFLAFGCAMAALVTNLPLMILARSIQGLGGAIFPLSFGIIRDEFPRPRIPNALGTMSGVFGIGGGLGIVLAGPILEYLSYHWLFWIPCIFTLGATAATVIVIPESPVRAPGDIHWLGALLLSGWLIALLLAISQAPTWGWGSPKTLGLIGLAGVIAALWVRAESRCDHPLVDMAMMRLRGVWTTNVATLLIGFGMFTSFVLISQYVQAPTFTGYGLGATVTQAGFYLIPSTLGMLVFSPIGGRLSTAVGSKVPLVAGASISVVAFIVLALTSSSGAIYLASGLQGIGNGLAFASFANLIVQAVRPDQTGVASGMNTIVRTIGSAIGAEVAASILAANMLASGYPSKHAYTVAYALSAVVLLLAVLASLAVPGRVRSRRAAAPEPVTE
jgi:EmrB/QacA subfamily drug resistance transporter